jgi:hypothetical protein
VLSCYHRVLYSYGGWPGAPSSKSDVKRMEDVSHLISQKMLQGWALLDKACEVGCSGDVPLMRDPKTKQV